MLRSLLIPDVGKLCNLPTVRKFSNPLSAETLVLSPTTPAAEPGVAPEVDLAADPTADAAVDPAANLADQRGGGAGVHCPAKLEGLFADFLTYCSRRLHLASHESY